MKKKNNNIEKVEKIKEYKYHVKNLHTKQENENHDKEMLEKHRQEMRELSIKKKIKGNEKYLNMFQEICEVNKLNYNIDELKNKINMKPNSYIKMLFETLHERSKNI